MILSGKQIIQENLVTDLLDLENQIQPCGVDFTLKKLAIWTSSGSIDFDNSHRILSNTNVVEFDHEDRLILKQGGYLVEFNEMVSLPKNVMATVQTRSSLFRCGASFVAGVIDPGYKGAVGGLLQVWNKKGITLYRNAKLVQWVFSRLEKSSDSKYSGRYQNAKTII
jgi:dUTP pyrophosphatase